MISSQLLLPFYILTIILILIVTMFLVDKQTPLTIFFIFIAMYTALVFYIWRQHKNSKSNDKKMKSLDDLKQQKEQTSVLSNFQAQAQKILRQINMQKNQNSVQQKNYYSSYTNYYSPMTLAELSSQANDYPEQSNAFGTYNTQTWREQFRLASEQFILNLASPLPQTHIDSYKTLLQKLNIKPQSIPQCQQIVTNLLKDRVKQYTHTAMDIVNEVNKILTRNFGLNLTKVQSTNPKQIGIEQFMKLVNYYNVNRVLPSGYRNIAINYPGNYQYQAETGMGMSYQTSSSLPSSSSFSLTLNRNNNNNYNKLDSDMQQLAKYLYFIEPISYHPNDQFNPSMLLYILREQFPNQNIYVNKDAKVNQNQAQNQQSLFGLSRNRISYSFVVQIDYWISLAGFSEFRTKNCMRICLIFMLVLLRNQSNYGHPVLRALRKLQK